MIIETREDGGQIHARIMEGEGPGHLVLRSDVLISDREQHADAARELADRPAVRVLERTSQGYIFEA